MTKKHAAINYIREKVTYVFSWMSSNKLLTIAALWFAFMWSWCIQTDSLDLAGNKKQGTIVATLVMLTNILISLVILHFFMTHAQNIFKRIEGFKAALLLIVLFALCDYLISWLLALFWIGPQAQWDSILPIGSATFLIVRTPLVFAGRLIGYFGLAGFVWSFLYLILNKKHRKLAIVPAGLIVALSVAGWAIYKSALSPKYKATLISEELTQRVPAIESGNNKVVLFPEYGLEKITNENLSSRIKASSNKTSTYFAGSEQVYKPNRYGHENRLLFGNTKDGITGYQDKFRLIPGGEDAPFIVRSGLRATGQVATLNYFSYAKSVIKGKEQLRVWNLDEGVKVGLAVCSSIIAPQDYRHFTRSGATVLANSASLKPFGGSRLFAWQQQSMGRFMAVANSRYFLQSANSASAYAYDNNGRLLAQKYGVDSVQVDFASVNKTTFYTSFGEILVWLGGFTLVVIYAQRLKSTRSRGKHDGKSKREK